MLKKITPHLNRQNLRQVWRYGVIGIANNSLGYGAYLLLTYLGMPYKIAMTLVYLTAVTISFFGMRKWVFTHTGHLTRTALKFGFAHFLGYLLSLLMLFVFADTLGYKHQYVQGASVFVVAAFLFLMFRFFVFRHHEPQSNAS